ncbi:MAG TPA: LysM peptidoglycan-binding domain-containing protein [Verrucomicrobiae bacterium]|nr:LysM peptidoglycan-binding domain-containing protein [Verrucomicrobiae bacterium]
MSFGNRLILALSVVALGVALSGCEPSDQSRSDEENEPHFILGKNRVNAMDYQGAVEAFEESVEANPRSAAAHFELAWLYDEKIPDPAAAIYHYQEYLKFNSHADNADVIKQRIYRCKQQLAADVLPLPSAPAMQQQLEKLAEQNRQLQDEVDKWRAYYASQSTTKPDSLAAQGDSISTVQTNSIPKPSVQSRSTPGNVTSANRASTSTSARTHSVASGETAMSITRKFGVKLSALQAANPGVNLSRLKVGQTLNIP